jgi:hypothetical protein
MGERFVMRTVSGSRGPTNPQQGLSAVVLDTTYNYATVAQYRSEDVAYSRGWGKGNFKLKPEGAILEAQAHCDRLNARA